MMKVRTHKFMILLYTFIFISLATALFVYVLEKRPRDIMKADISDYKVHILDDGSRTLRFTQESSHSMLSFEGANLEIKNDALFLKIKYCRGPSLFCRLDLSEITFDPTVNAFKLGLPKGEERIYIDFNREGIELVETKYY